MNFEHLVQINDPANPLVTSLSREQLWEGLRYRVQNPLPFLPGLEAFRVLETFADGVLRELDFGPARIQDRVTLAEGHWVRFDIQPSEAHAGGSLTITIEEPEAGRLFLRFAYRTTLGETTATEDAAYARYVQSAYYQSDLDCVRLIRTLAAGGQPQ